MAYQAWSVVFGEQPSAAKWNILGTNDAGFNDGTAIGTSAITPEKLLAGTGTSWPWVNWTPIYVNMTIGNATVNGRYKQIGNTVVGTLTITFGTTTSITSTFPSYSLPVTAKTSVNGITGVAMYSYLDTGSARFYGQTLIGSAATNLALTVSNVAGSYASEQGISSGVPFTWVTTDVIHISFFYEAA